MHVFIFFTCILSLYGVQIKIQDQVLDVEIADTPFLWAQGLMFREEVPEGTGMLFVYPDAAQRSFWMKNTRVPLSIAFFDDQKAILHILDMDPPTGNVVLRYQSIAPALYALEVPQGWFRKYGIELGAKFSFLP